MPDIFNLEKIILYKETNAKVICKEQIILYLRSVVSPIFIILVGEDTLVNSQHISDKT